MIPQPFLFVRCSFAMLCYNFVTLSNSIYSLPAAVATNDNIMHSDSFLFSKSHLNYYQTIALYLVLIDPGMLNEVDG